MERIDERNDGRRHHVDACREELGDVVDGLGGPQVGGRGVADSVGLQGEDLFDAVRGSHSERLAADDVTSVTAGLFRGVDPQADQFVAMMRSGKRPDGTDVSRVMPFGAFEKMNDTDLNALYLFLAQK